MSKPDRHIDAAGLASRKVDADGMEKDEADARREGAPGAEPVARDKALPDHLRKLAGKYAKKLRKTLKLACDGDEAGVHDLRVATRRLQAIIELLDPARRDKKITQLRKNLKALRHAAGNERDLRLFARSARQRASRAASPARRRVWRQIAADLAAEFTRASRDAHKRLRRRSASALAKTIKQAVRRNGDHIDVGQIAKEIENARNKLAASLREAKASHAASGYHNVRIKAKSLRYLFEVRAKLAANSGDDSAIELLKSVQDELGDWHDEVELCRRATAALSANADRQADAGATEVLDAMRRRSGAINQHAREVAGRLCEALGLNGGKDRRIERRLDAHKH